MSSALDILRNANRMILDQLDAVDERIKAKEDEVRQILEECVSRRENIRRKREILQEIEHVQLESLVEIEAAEACAGESLQRPGANAMAAPRMADRMSFAVVKASQTANFMKR
jgi:hypothetical protein